MTTINLGAGTLYFDGKPIGGVRSATLTRGDSWPPYYPQQLQTSASFTFGEVTPQMVLMMGGPELFPMHFPPRRTYRPSYGEPARVDATLSIQLHLDRLERAELGPRRKDVTRGEWFALAMERRRQRERAADTAFARIAAFWGGPIDSHPRPPTHYELSDTGSYRAASRLEPRHRPFPP